MKKQHTKRSFMLLGFVLSFILVAAVNVYANPEVEGDGAKGKDFRKNKIAEMHEKLGLSEEQQVALKEYRQKNRDESKGLREELKIKRKAFHEVMKNPESDEATIRQLNKELQVLQNKMADNRVERTLEIRKLLTPEQFEKFNELKRQGHKNRKGKFKEKWKEHKGSKAE